MLYLLTKQGRLSRRQAKALYNSVMTQSRNPRFYSEFGVSDTMEGRFEMLSLHGGLLVSRLCQPDMGKDGKILAQAFFDVMFKSLDLSIREMGVGDLAVPRRIKKMMSDFKGRAFAYDESTKASKSELVHALSRNIFMTEKPPVHILDSFADYVQSYAAELGKQSPSDFWQGKIVFPPIQTTNGTVNAPQAA